ncbi:MAG TPA: YfhO family protein, partial [Gemmatimonadales bacterium]|nr:YfhO family protein [Gemmatimonadales bacterium]
MSNPKRTPPPPAETFTPYTPAWPTLTAFGFLCLWIASLSLPMWSGQFLARAPFSDQAIDGYAIRWWGADVWRMSGHPPQWNPYLFGGHPVFTGFGDLFYPSAWLRLMLPTVTAMNLTFVLHYLLAGLFVYLLLRQLGLSWLGSLTGATGYQLSGVVVSLVSPGHDGKLFVTAMLPLMLLSLVLAIRRRRWEGYALLGLAVGLALLSPQYQMAQYALITSGIFTLYLAFGEPVGLTPRERWLAFAGAAGGVVLGFGISMIQVLPFFHTIPYGTRAGEAGYAWSASYAMPWSHVPELFLSG